MTLLCAAECKGVRLSGYVLIHYGFLPRTDQCCFSIIVHVWITILHLGLGCALVVKAVVLHRSAAVHSKAMCLFFPFSAQVQVILGLGLSKYDYIIFFAIIYYNHIVLSTSACIFIRCVIISYCIQFIFIFNHILIILIFNRQLWYRLMICEC